MHNPILYQANIRLWLDELGQTLGRQATLDDLPDDQLDRLAGLGFEWLYLICAWETGAAEAGLARANPYLREEARQKLGEAGSRDLCGSCFAVSGYTVREAWGGRAALARLKARLNRRGMRLMLDFIPNHTGISHPWGRQRPDFYVEASPETAAKKIGEFYPVKIGAGERFLAHGRDPYFPPWSDTLQLNYANPALQEAMRNELIGLSGLCDGVRCDMAMLIIPGVFRRTWGLEAAPFWPGALEAVRQKRPDFTFMAEVYWGLEKELLEQGFDYTYDKQLYDRLIEGRAQAVRDQIREETAVIGQQAHFLENHDEPRAAAAFQDGKHQAAAVLTYFLPGLRFFFAGQLEGDAIRSPVQFCRAPTQAGDPGLSAFYARLMELLRESSSQTEAWKLLETRPAWPGSAASQNFIVFTWANAEGGRWLAAVNYADQPGQCIVEMAVPEISGREYRLQDRLNSRLYVRNGDQMARDGLYLDLPGWGYHLLEFCPEA